MKTQHKVSLVVCFESTLALMSSNDKEGSGTKTQEEGFKLFRYLNLDGIMVTH